VPVRCSRTKQLNRFTGLSQCCLEVLTANIVEANLTPAREAIPSNREAAMRTGQTMLNHNCLVESTLQKYTAFSNSKAVAAPKQYLTGNASCLLQETLLQHWLINSPRRVSSTLLKAWLPHSRIFSGGHCPPIARMVGYNKVTHNCPAVY